MPLTFQAGRWEEAQGRSLGLGLVLGDSNTVTTTGSTTSSRPLAQHLLLISISTPSGFGGHNISSSGPCL